MEYEKVFNIFLDMILLVLPLFVLGATYFMITRTLWQGIQTERDFKNQLNHYNKCCELYLGTLIRTHERMTRLVINHRLLINPD